MPIRFRIGLFERSLHGTAAGVTRRIRAAASVSLVPLPAIRTESLRNQLRIWLLAGRIGG